MNRILLLSLYLVLYTSCAVVTVDNPYTPRFKGVDVELTPYENRFFDLAVQSGIHFRNQVTMGLAILNNGAEVGECQYGVGWREITIDSTYWNRASEIERTVLILHELGHCYCGRDHDYGNGIAYPESIRARTEEYQNWLKYGGPRPGRYDADSCPLSLMYPAVLDADCYLTHYYEYIQELFNRCKAY